MSAGPVGLLDRKLLFVTGKGGVGKTSVASAIAMLAASRGKRTLVCEVDAKGNLADFLGVGPLRFQPTEVRKRLFAMSMDTEESLKEYMRLNLKLPLLAKMGPLARTFPGQTNNDGRRSPGRSCGQIWLASSPRRSPSTTWSRSDSSGARPTG